MFNNTKEQIIFFVKENKWILLSLFIFIIWKFFLISILFNHNPEWSVSSEEAQTYISNIGSINECDHIIFCEDFLLSLKYYSGFEHLSYRLFFGFIGHLLKINALAVFHLSFYIGILILAISLISFLKKIETNKKLIAFSLFFLTLYNGGGSHGFWWVVPDFFAILLLFIIFTIMLGNHKYWKILLLVLIPIGIYVHTMFVYLMLNPVFFYIFYSFLTKKIDILLLKKIVFSIIILIIFYIPSSLYLGGNPYGPETFILNILKLKSNVATLTPNTQSSEKNTLPTAVVSKIASEKELSLLEQSEDKQDNIKRKNIFPGFKGIKDRYFNFIFFNPIFIIIFIWIFFILFYYKQYKIISFYFAALIFTLISSINENADRSITFIWPITFLIYAYGAWFSFELFDKLLKNKFINLIAKAFQCFGIIIFIIINLIYSYGVNQSIYFGSKELFAYVWNIW